MSISFLMFVNIPKYLDTHLANSAVGGHKIKRNFSTSDSNKKLGKSADKRPKKHCLFNLKVSQKK